jgi:hypothetical protein
MNDTNTLQQQTEFVLRRLSDSLSFGGREVSPYFWLAILIPVLALGLVYVAWQYRRDCRSIAWPWAVFLGTLRATVYLILAGIFLLPAMQTWERTEKHSRVLVLLDVSPSVAMISDDLPEEGSVQSKPVTRLDKVVAFLADKQTNFLGRILEHNPVHLYRFGSRLDEEAAVFEPGQSTWDAERWSAWLRCDFKQWLLRGLTPEAQVVVQRLPAFESDKPGTTEWAFNWLKLATAETTPDGLTEADHAKLADNRAKLDKRLEAVRQLNLGTNVGESVLTLFNRESSNPIQGVVIVSDGRSNLGSDSSIEDLRAKARKDKVPIFSVQVGEDRQPINIRITDVQTPEQTPPDEKFVIRVEIDGEGLPDQETKVFLDLYRPDEDKPAHTMETSVRFQAGEPPHAQAEFTLDPEQLPDDLKGEGSKELVEGEWKFVVRVPKAAKEIFVGKDHVSDSPATVQIIKKPLRVLLVASGPMKDYQFVRTLFVREKDAKRAELSVFLQSEGRDGRAVQDVEPERFLNRFPATLQVEDDPNEKQEDRYYNLARYDLIIAFDPDWSEFTAEQLQLLQKWVDQQAGGLILVAGPVNTFQLARDDNSGRLKPVIDLFPVVVGDIVLQTGPVRRTARTPWRLQFPGANPDMEFLKLDDESKEPLSGWPEFFDGPEKKLEGTPRRGFYDVYPIKSVKPGATVVATFTDPAAKIDGKDHPFLVTQQFGKGRVMFLASAEIWRLRGYREAFFERFWTKVGRYASAGSRTRQNRRGILVMGRQFVSGQNVRLEAQLFGPTLEPLPKATKPTLSVVWEEDVEKLDADGRPMVDKDGRRVMERKTFKRSVDMTAKPSQNDWAGWFQGRFPVVRPGQYKVELPIPSSSDVLRDKFVVKESNPELDNTRPDPGALALMAGDLDEVKDRLSSKAALDELRQKLHGPRPAASASDKAENREPGTAGDAPKLLFTLTTADAIPQCLPGMPPKVSRSRGPVTDLWDTGPELGTNEEGKPRTVATLLMVIVGLLSVEWLTRKLLRLA